MPLIAMIKVEYLKLFRRSNLLFIFLSLYLFITPVGRGFDTLRENATVSAGGFLGVLSESMAIFSMLMMAVFMVNNLGVDFNEGSYRRSIALGMKKIEFFSGKVFLILLLSFGIILLKYCIYFVFGLALFKLPLTDLLLAFTDPNMIFFFVGLVFAGFFGMAFMTVFRNRSIGLVFFPIWMLTEIFVLAFSLSGRLGINHNLFPGIAGWQIQTTTNTEPIIYFVVIGYFSVFILSSYFGLTLREVRK
jgi:hypothetical protein